MTADDIKDYLLVVLWASGTLPDGSKWLASLVTKRLDSSYIGANWLFGWSIWLLMVRDLYQEERLKVRVDSMSDQQTSQKVLANNDDYLWMDSVLHEWWTKVYLSSEIFKGRNPLLMVLLLWFCPCKATTWSVCCWVPLSFDEMIEQVVGCLLVLGQCISASHMSQLQQIWPNSVKCRETTLIVIDAKQIKIKSYKILSKQNKKFNDIFIVLPSFFC